MNYEVNGKRKHFFSVKSDVLRAIASGASVHKIASRIVATTDRDFHLARAKAVAELAMIFKIPHRHAHAIISEHWID